MSTTEILDAGSGAAIGMLDSPHLVVSTMSVFILFLILLIVALWRKLTHKDDLIYKIQEKTVDAMHKLESTISTMLKAKG